MGRTERNSCTKVYSISAEVLTIQTAERMALFSIYDSGEI